MEMFRGILAALFIYACFYGVYEIGVWQGNKKCKHHYEFKKTRVAFQNR